MVLSAWPDGTVTTPGHLRKPWPQLRPGSAPAAASCLHSQEQLGQETLGDMTLGSHDMKPLRVCADVTRDTKDTGLNSSPK